MRRNLASRIVAAGIMAMGALGTSCVNYREGARNLKASTNTLSAQSGANNYIFKREILGELVTPTEKYLVLPFDRDELIEIQGAISPMSELEVLVKNRIMLPLLLVPHSESSPKMTADSTGIVQNGKAFLAVNAYVDASGNLDRIAKAEMEKGPRESFYVLSREKFERITGKKGKGNAGAIATFNGTRYYSLAAGKGIDNAPRRLLIPVDAARQLYLESEAGDNKEAKFGLNGPGYFFFEIKMLGKSAAAVPHAASVHKNRQHFFNNTPK